MRWMRLCCFSLRSHMLLVTLPLSSAACCSAALLRLLLHPCHVIFLFRIDISCCCRTHTVHPADIYHRFVPLYGAASLLLLRSGCRVMWSDAARDPTFYAAHVSIFHEMYSTSCTSSFMRMVFCCWWKRRS